MLLLPVSDEFCCPLLAAILEFYKYSHVLTILDTGLELLELSLCCLQRGKSVNKAFTELFQTKA